jgi:hypothetical protein
MKVLFNPQAFETTQLPLAWATEIDQRDTPFRRLM